MTDSIGLSLPHVLTDSRGVGHECRLWGMWHKRGGRFVIQKILLSEAGGWLKQIKARDLWERYGIDWSLLERDQEIQEKARREVLGVYN
jgi:hypothetical protein